MELSKNLTKGEGENYETYFLLEIFIVFLVKSTKNN
jgi:hypothetical protein